MIEQLSKQFLSFPKKYPNFLRSSIIAPSPLPPSQPTQKKRHLSINSSPSHSRLYYAAQMFTCLLNMEGKYAAKLEKKKKKKSRLGSKSAFFHCVHSAFLLTVSSCTAGCAVQAQMPSLLLLLAAVLLSPKRIYCTTDRCWDSEDGAESQRDWIRKQKWKKKKKEEPYQNKSLHCTHISPWGEERDRCQAFCFGHSWKLLKFYTKERTTGSHKDLHKNLNGDSARKKDVSSEKRDLKSSFLSVKVTLIIKHKVLAFLMLSYEGSLWTEDILGFLFFPHTHSFKNSLTSTKLWTLFSYMQLHHI